MKTLVLQTECNTIAGVSQLIKYMKHNYSFTYAEPTYSNKLSKLPRIKPEQVSEFTDIILTPILVSYMRSGEVPYIPYIESAIKNKVNVTLILHGSIQGIDDNTFNKLSTVFKQYSDAVNRGEVKKLTILYLHHEYMESYKRRLPTDVLDNVEFKYCPYTSLGILPIITIARESHSVEKLANNYSMICRDTNNRIARYFDELPKASDINWHVITSINGRFNHVTDSNVHYYINLTNDDIKFRVLNSTTKYCVGSFYKPGLHVLDHAENGLEWGTIEAIATGNLVVPATPEFNTAFSNANIYTANYVGDTPTFDEYLDHLESIPPLTRSDIDSNINSLIKLARKDINEIVDPIFKLYEG